jgi:hypothetical protein
VINNDELKGSKDGSKFFYATASDNLKKDKSRAQLSNSNSLERLPPQIRQSLDRNQSLYKLPPAKMYVRESLSSLFTQPK